MDWASFQPGGAVGGTPRLSPSKSLVQRLLLLGAVAHGRTILCCADRETPWPEDAIRALFSVASLGPATFSDGGSRSRPCMDVQGRGPGEPTSSWTIDAGESATLARLATALAALALPPGTRQSITAEGSLLRRSSVPLFEALRAAGAGLAATEGERWPVSVVAAAPPRWLELREPVSSQEVSGLLLALAATTPHPDVPAELAVRGTIPSRPYLDMTVALLRRYGAQVEERVHDGGSTWRVQGPLVAPDGPFELEPDASAAAVVLAAACLSGGDVTVPGLGEDSLQGDVRIVEHLVAFGCDALSTIACLTARGRPTRGADLDLAGEPDLAPVLAAVGAAVALDPEVPRDAATTVLRGLDALPRKESDRLAVLARGLGAAGLDVSATADSLTIRPGAAGAPAELLLDPDGDHRMAFAFALLGLVRPGVRVATPGCVAKSWPRFWTELERLGARRVVG